MTESDKLAMLKVMTDTELSDAELGVYLTIAGQKILAKAYPYKDVADVPSRYHYLQVEVAAYMVNKIGADYQTSHSENGITRAYEAPDVPPSMLRTIIPHCGGIHENDADQ
jgi:hypothetical protein